jgi:hypothetical protein
MRKGFIPTLTALVTAFLVTSAMALGPTVTDIPDVYIGDNGVAPLTEPFTHVYRYSDAIVLWDYVAHEADGTATGNGSTSDTLYWAWAAKAADLSGGTGAFLDPGNFVYSIIQGNTIEGTEIQPLQTPGTAAWTAEINNALVALGGSLTDHSVAAASALTFRNIRVSPLDQNYSAPSPSPGTPAGYIDIQEATLFVSDTVTTPGYNAALILTVESPSFDALSGGAVWGLEEDLANTSGFTYLKLSGVVDNFNAAATVETGPPATGGPVTQVTVSNTGTVLSITTPLARPSPTNYLYGQYGRNTTAALDTSKIYRLQGTVASTAATTSANATWELEINGRANGPGLGYLEFGRNPAGNGGPTNGNPGQYSAYLRPLASATAQIVFRVFDDDGTVGSTMSASNLDLFGIPAASLVNPVQTLAVTNFSVDPTNIVPNYPTWGYYRTNFAGMTLPGTMTGLPGLGGSGAELVHTVVVGSSTQKGFAWFHSSGAFTATAGKLVVVDFQVSSTSAISSSAKTPDLWLGVSSNGAGFNAALLSDPTVPDLGNNPTSTPKSYYAIFEAVAGSYNLWFRCVGEDFGSPFITVNGNIRCSDITVTEYDMPALP